jgi:hypothetical protein
MNEGHRRFQEWLTAGAESDPPRDAAVHASVCDSCRQSTAALDQLAAVDPGRAPIPTAPPVELREEWAHSARLAAVAAAVLFGAVLLGVGASQLIGLTRGNGSIAQASRAPDQGVLGGTATAQPSADGVSASPGQSLDASVPPSPTTRPVSGATARPRRSPSPTATPQATSTSGQTPTQRGTPTGNPTPTMAATPTPTPTLTPTPTPIPTPAPTAPGQITDLVASQGLFPGEIDLSWSAPADGGSQIQSYTLCRGLASGAETPPCVSVAATGYVDSTATSGMQYWYTVVAVNAVGTGPVSNEAHAIAP